MRKITALILAAVLTLGLTATAEAAEESAAVPTFDVTLNGVRYDSAMSEYPLLVYKEITYVPMTYYTAELLGLRASWTAETGLSVTSEPTGYCLYKEYPRETANAASYAVSVAAGPVTVNGVPIDNASEPYPLLLFRDITYFPLTWRFCHDLFGWAYDFSFENGLRIVSGGAASYDGASWLSVKTLGGESNKLSVMRREIGNLDVTTVFEIENSAFILYGELREYDDGLWYRYTVGGSAIMSTIWKVKLGKTAGEPVVATTASMVYPMGDAPAPEDAILYDGIYYFISPDGQYAVSLSAKEGTTTGHIVLYVGNAAVDSVALEDGKPYARYTLGGETYRVRLYEDDHGEIEKV